MTTAPSFILPPQGQLPSCGTLDVIDPCTCAVTEVGATGYGSIPGITADYGLGLFGIETTNDLLVALDPNTAAGTTVGSSGVDFGTSGATWSDDLDGGQGGLYGINGTTNQLYSVDRNTGAATPIVTISGVTFGPVGAARASGASAGVLESARAYSSDRRSYANREPLTPPAGGVRAIGV